MSDPETAPEGQPLQVATIGSGPRTVWVHGTMSDAARTWKHQLDLAKRWTLVLPNRRGTPPSPPAAGNDFDADAVDLGRLLDRPAHLVAHSYGSVGALLAAVQRPQSVRSLTVIEPPVYQLALADPAVKETIEAFGDMRRLASPDEFLARFLQTVLAQPPPAAALDAAARRLVELTMRERPPWTAELRLEGIRAAGIPVLVITGGHRQLFEVCADALAAALAPHAERVVLPGAGHSAQRLGEPFNELLERFWRRVEQAAQASPP